MRAAIERRQGEVASQNAFTALLGFRELGYELLSFEQGEVEALEADPEIVVVGGIASTHGGLQRLGLEPPLIEGIPAPLRPFAGRRVWSATMGEVRRLVDQGKGPFFVKPASHMHKAFPAGVVLAFRDLIPSAAVGDEERVTCSDVVEFRTEYRVFAREGRIADCRRYRGSHRELPDFHVVDAALEAYGPAAPAGYALDVGVDAQQRTLVVEVNDGYSLGTYGMEPVPYARLLAARWQQLVAAP